MKRAYKFRAYPTRPQQCRAVRLLADHCDLYNAALEERREAWRRHKASITYVTQSAQLKDIRAGQQPGYPRFRPRSRFDQAMFVAGDGAK